MANPREYRVGMGDSGSRFAHLFEGRADGADEVGWRAGLGEELHVQALIFLLRFYHAAYDNDRDFLVDAAQFPDEIRSGRAGHYVIGNNYAQPVCHAGGTEQSERSLDSGGNGHRKAGFAKD